MLQAQRKVCDIFILVGNNWAHWLVNRTIKRL